MTIDQEGVGWDVEVLPCSGILLLYEIEKTDKVYHLAARERRKTHLISGITPFSSQGRLRGEGSSEMAAGTSWSDRETWHVRSGAFHKPRAASAHRSGVHNWHGPQLLRCELAQPHQHRLRHLLVTPSALQQNFVLYAPTEDRKRIFRAQLVTWVPMTPRSDPPAHAEILRTQLRGPNPRPARVGHPATAVGRKQSASYS